MIALSRSEGGLPASGLTTYQYYANGALKSRLDARGAGTTYTVDGLGRVIGKSYTGTSTPSAVYCFDGQVVNASGACVWDTSARTDYPQDQLTEAATLFAGRPVLTSTRYDYDVLGNAWHSRFSVHGSPGVSGVFTDLYNAAGGLTSVIYPSQRQISYGRTGANRVESVTGAGRQYLTGATYADHGAPATATVGGVMQEVWQYNSRLQPRSQTVTRAGSGLLGRNWVYSASYDPATFLETGSSTDNNGNLRGEKVTWTGGPHVRTYANDSVDRPASFRDGAVAHEFRYDRFGNV